jgi:hypothetical protein
VLGRKAGEGQAGCVTVVSSAAVAVVVQMLPWSACMYLRNGSSVSSATRAHSRVTTSNGG